MKKLMKKILVVVALGVACRVDAVTKFDAAESVWPEGLATEMNTLIAFRAPFEVKEGERPVLKMVAWYSYRVTLNGTFVGFGPARGPKGFFRPDEWDLAKAAKPGRNELCVEVAGYNVPNFYQMEQPPFFKAEVVCDGRIRAATKRTGGDFAATRQPRVQKVPRYSFQRTFAEAYRLPAPAQPPVLALVAAPEPALIERRAPYPDFEVNPRMTPVSFARIRLDETVPVHTNHALALPGKSSAFKGFGFPLADCELNVSFLAQRLVSANRRPATAEERGTTAFPLAAGQSAVFDNGLNDSGFPGLRVEVKEPGRLVMQFDEVLSANGAARGILRDKGCCNALVWDFVEPGVYEVDAFEPYTMRYVELDVVSGEMVVSAPRFRSYKNPTAKRARFRASDPALVKIFDAARETFRQNAVDVFTDCPGRERAGWNCDAYFTSPVSTLLTGDFTLERIFEENLALPLAFDDIPDGALPMSYPSDHRDRTHIPNWGMWFVLETEEYLRRTGDRETVEVLRPRLEKFVAFLWAYRNADGLLERLPGWIFVEWSRANKLVRDVNYPSNMTWADTLDAMDRLYGRADLAAEAARVRETVRRQSWTGSWFCDNAVRQKDGSLRLSGECTETCQYYAFFHKVAMPETHPVLWKRLLMDFGPSRYNPADRTKLLKYPEIWPSNAFIGNYLRLKLLERAGLGRQILDETKGYFTYMAERTGTLWEHDRESASCNHGFASYVAVLLVHSVLGVEVDHLKKTVTVRPTDVDLDFCGVTLPVLGGEIAYDWTKKDGRREETFAAPPGWRLVHVSADRLYISHVHRGGGKAERPDNTLETFKWCWENGSAVECDCRKTKDGVGVMLHDDNLKRTGRGISEAFAKKSVSNELTWDEIKNVDVGSYLAPEYASERVPTIEATFAAMKGHPTYLCFVDEKGAGPEYIAQKAMEAGVQDQVYYTGPSHEKILEWNRILPGGKSLLWIGAWPKDHGPQERARADLYFRDQMERLRAKDFAYISAVSIHSYYDPNDPQDPFVPSTEVLNEIVREFHLHGIPVVSIPFQGGEKEETYFKLHDLGFDGFSTDYPSVMFSVIRKLRADRRDLSSSGRWTVIGRGLFARERNDKIFVF